MAEEETKEETDLSAEALAEAEERELQVYELGFHILSSIEEQKVVAEVDSIKASIEKHGGVFITEELPKKINLAYTMDKEIEGKRQKFDTAYFGWIKFEMQTENIMNAKEDMDSSKSILRFIIIRTVRESTLAPRSAIFAKEDLPTQAGPKQIKQKPILKVDEKEKKEGPKMTEEELDKTIEELIIE